MTTPHQSAGQALGNNEHLLAILGQGAFTIGDHPHNWGQGLTKSAVQALINGPAGSLGQNFSHIGDMVGAIGDYLRTLPLEVLQQMQAFIPGKTIDLHFPDVATSVSTILDALNLGTMSVKLGDFTGWLSDTYLILQTEWRQFVDLIRGVIVTPITTRVAELIDWWTNLGPELLQDLYDLIWQKLHGGSDTGKHLSDVGDELGGFLGNLETAVTGAVKDGVQSTKDTIKTALEGLLDGHNGAVRDIADVLHRLQPQQPKKSSGGAAPVVISSGWGAEWDLSGSTSTACVTDKGYFMTDSGNTPRTLFGMHVDPVSSPYQSVRFLLETLMEKPLSGGSGNCGNSLVFRADSPTAPSTYGELRFYYNKAELWGFTSGTGTLAHTWSITPSNGLTYSLDVGNVNGLDRYQLYGNGQPIGTEFHDTGSLINITGLYGGQKMYTDTRGSTESSPGAVSYFKFSDNVPGQKVGSGFKVCRTDTTEVSFPAASATIPNSFYDTVDRMTDDYTWDASTSTLTVRDEGWYQFTLALPFLAHNGQYQIFSLFGAMLAVDGVVDSLIGPSGFGDIVVTDVHFAGSVTDTEKVGPTGVFGTFPEVYCQAGSTVQPCYTSGTTRSIAGGYGTQTAFAHTTSYFSGHKLGQAVV